MPAILLGIPGTPSSITTCFDGYPMCQQGDGEKALRIGIIASLVGGLISLAGLYFFAPALADFAIKFSYVEKFLIILFALTVMAALSSDMLFGIFSGFLGLFVCLIGTYSIQSGGNGEIRLIPPGMGYWLESGFALLPVLIGLFGLAAILEEAEVGVPEGASARNVRIGAGTGFSLSVFRGQIGNLIRSSGIGTFVGILPGVGGSAASILSYTAAKAPEAPRDLRQRRTCGHHRLGIRQQRPDRRRAGAAVVARHPRRQHHRAVDRRLHAAGHSGRPALHRQQSGDLERDHRRHADRQCRHVRDDVCGHPLLAHVVSVPKHILFPIILMMCVIGAYTINYGIMFDVWTLLIFGLFGWLAVKLRLEIAPFIIGFILGPSAEIYFVKSLESFGDLTIFFTKSWIAVRSGTRNEKGSP